MEKKYYYKAMNKDMKCRGFQFKAGETYTIDSKELELCSDKVFHFCKRLEDTIDYYNNTTDKHFVIEVLGDIVTKWSKSGSNKIRIVREISREEIEEHIQDKISYEATKFLALYSKKRNILKELLKSENKYIRKALAENLNTSVYILGKLAKDVDEDVRRAVASNPNTSTRLLKKMFKDEDWGVRVAVVQNPNTSTRTFKKISKDEFSIVRLAVAENQNSLIYTLEELSKDKNWIIRKAVAKNLNTPVYILEELAKDEDADVRKEAQKRLKEITQ